MIVDCWRAPLPNLASPPSLASLRDAAALLGGCGLAKLFYRLMPASAASASALSVFSQLNVGSLRPKWP
jgi:hypothetical protein